MTDPSQTPAVGYLPAKPAPSPLELAISHQNEMGRLLVKVHLNAACIRQILVLAATGEGVLRYRDVCAALGGEPWTVLNSLKDQGGLEHPGYDRWIITEKGRIAAALALAKDSELAGAVS